MEKKLILATNNKHKLTEFRRILQPLGFIVNSPAELGIDSNPIEDGLTFAENAFIKASALKALAPDCYIVADDSGICVSALDGAPGIYSARFAGENATSQQNNEKLLELLQAQKDRTAYFVCAIVLLTPSGDRQDFIGECHGEIADSPQGEGGFGYDPIFLYNGTSFALLSDNEKDAVSHRGKAVSSFTDFLESQLGGDR